MSEKSPLFLYHPLISSHDYNEPKSAFFHQTKQFQEFFFTMATHWINWTNGLGIGRLRGISNLSLEIRNPDHVILRRYRSTESSLNQTELNFFYFWIDRTFGRYIDTQTRMHTNLYMNVLCFNTASSAHCRKLSTCKNSERGAVQWKQHLCILKVLT